MTKPDNLLPCPWCGDTSVYETRDCVICNACGAQGPDVDHCVGDAAALWNQRAQPDPEEIDRQAAHAMIRLLPLAAQMSMHDPSVIYAAFARHRIAAAQTSLELAEALSGLLKAVDSLFPTDGPLKARARAALAAAEGAEPACAAQEERIGP